LRGRKEVSYRDNYTDEEFERSYSEFVKLMNKAISGLDDSELFSMKEFFNVTFYHTQPSKDDLSRAIFAKLREIRKDIKKLDRIKSSARELKSLL